MKTIKFFLFVSLFVFSYYASAVDYYWVGGSGQWSEYNLHWATSSGGATFHSQVPTNSDNVFFDANSGFVTGSEVKVDQTIIYCNNMDWTGAAANPKLSTSDNTNIIKIYGSLKLIVNMKYLFNGVISFEGSTTGNTITSAAKSFSQLDFRGTGGEWILQDSLKVDNNFIMESGTIKANNQVIVAPYFSGVGGGTKQLILGNADFITSSWSLEQGTNFNLQPGTSTFVFNLAGNNAKLAGGQNDLTFYNVVSKYIYGGKLQITGYHNDYHKLMLGTDCEISSGMPAHYDSLILSPSRQYQMTGTHTINDGGKILANGTCQQPIVIDGVNSNTAIYVNASSIVASFAYCYVSNLQLVTGSTAVSITNSFDLGNTYGWNIPAPTSKNLYWVGGSGNWSNTAHWSTTSGGAGGSCIPTPADNVFFDANSGSNITVNANLSVIYCKDMDWTGALGVPTFPCGGSVLKVYGSLTFIPQLVTSFFREVYFMSSTAGTTIKSAGQIFRNDVYFNGTGEWLLQDDLTSQRDLYLNAGTIRSNNYKMTMATFNAISSSTSALYLGSSYMDLQGGTKQFVWNTSNPNFIFDAGTSTIHVSGYYPTNDIYTYNMVLNFYNFIVETSYPVVFWYGNKFHKLHLKANTETRGNNTCDSLILEPNFSYKLSAYTEINPGGDFVAKGTCDQMITISGKGFYGVNGGIKKVSGAITMDHVIVDHFGTDGNASFTATNSIDNGDNTGWNILASSPRNLYWIGGAGDWSNNSHWALTSGGAGGNCPPMPTDDVFFDGLSGLNTSGKTVTITNAQSYCHNMTWSGSLAQPILELDTDFDLYGSIMLASTMTLNSNNYKVIFKSSETGNYIKSAGNNFYDILFDNPKGKWELQDSLSVLDGITITRGFFKTDNYPLYANSMNIGGYYNDTITYVELGSSRIWLNEGIAFQSDSININFNAGTSEIILTGDNNGQYASIGMSVAMANFGFHFYNVTFKSSNSLSSIDGINHFHKLSLGMSTLIDNFNILDSLILWPGKTYTIAPFITQYFTSRGTLVANGLPDFPIEIISSSAGLQTNFNKEDGIVCGEYLFIKDLNATGGAQWYAGTQGANISNNSGWLFEDCPFTPTGVKEKGNTITTLSANPNPTTGALTLTYHTDQPGSSTIFITDLLGKEVKQEQWKLNAGQNELTMDLSTLEKGMYCLRIGKETENAKMKIIVY